MFIKINTEWEPRRKRKTDEVEEQIDEYDIEPRVRTLRTRLRISRKTERANK